MLVIISAVLLIDLLGGVSIYIPSLEVWPAPPGIVVVGSRRVSSTDPTLEQS